MSRLCRLKTKTHGEDGQWAYDEIVKQRKQIEALTAQVGVLREALQAELDYQWNNYKEVAPWITKAFATTPESALSEVRKAEREKCAKVCESVDSLASSNPPVLCAKLIRAME